MIDTLPMSENMIETQVVRKAFNSSIHKLSDSVEVHVLMKEKLQKRCVCAGVSNPSIKTPKRMLMCISNFASGSATTLAALETDRRKRTEQMRRKDQRSTSTSWSMSPPLPTCRQRSKFFWRAWYCSPCTYSYDILAPLRISPPPFRGDIESAWSL